MPQSQTETWLSDAEARAADYHPYTNGNYARMFGRHGFRSVRLTRRDSPYQSFVLVPDGSVRR